MLERYLEFDLEGDDLDCLRFLDLDLESERDLELDFESDLDRLLLGWLLERLLLGERLLRLRLISLVRVMNGSRFKGTPQVSCDSLDLRFPRKSELVYLLLLLRSLLLLKIK